MIFPEVFIPSNIRPVCFSKSLNNSGGPRIMISSFNISAAELNPSS